MEAAGQHQITNIALGVTWHATKKSYNIHFRNLIEVRKIAKIMATAILACYLDLMKAYINHLSHCPYAVSIRWVGRNAQSALNNFYQIDLENVGTCTAKTCPRNGRCQI